MLAVALIMGLLLIFLIITAITLFFTYWYITFPAVALIIVILGTGLRTRIAGMIAAALAGITAIMLYVTLNCWASTGVPQPCM